MKNYFHKIAHFDIDNTKLYNEWLNIATKQNIFDRTKENSRFKKYTKMYINYPIGRDENFDTLPYVADVMRQSGKDFRIENIIKDFQNTYTAEVVTNIHQFLTLKYKDYYKVNEITYNVLEPHSLVGRHTDKQTTPRFMLLVHALEGCQLEVLDTIFPITDIGGLYKLMVSVPHAAYNNSEDYRIAIFFDVVLI